MTNDAYGHAWRRVRARVLRGAQACAICGLPLDFDAPPRSRWAPSVDHVLSVKALQGVDGATRERLLLDERNCRCVHFGCNARRGAGLHDKPNRVSREWI